MEIDPYSLTADLWKMFQDLMNKYKDHGNVQGLLFSLNLPEPPGRCIGAVKSDDFRRITSLSLDKVSHTHLLIFPIEISKGRICGFGYWDGKKFRKWILMELPGAHAVHCGNGDTAIVADSLKEGVKVLPNTDMIIPLNKYRFKKTTHIYQKFGPFKDISFLKKDPLPV
jgi:hypothetical protein